MTACAKTGRRLLAGICIALLAFLSACAPVRTPAPLPPAPPAPLPVPPAPPAPLPEPVPPPVPPAPPRRTASLQLTDQGRILIERGSFDDAIRILERAIALNPHNGENYYYMAEAWLAKGSPAQAGEFNRLAGMYLDRALWSQRVEDQRREIEAAGE